MTDEEALEAADRAIEAMKSFGVTPALDRHQMAERIRGHVTSQDKSFQRIVEMVKKGKPS